MSTPIPAPVTLLGGTPPSTDVLLVAVIDRSGSMDPQMAAVRDGFNLFVAKQAELPGCRVSLVLFNDVVNVVQVAEPAASSIKLDARNCQASDGTALYDAAAYGILGAEAWVQNHPEFAGKVIISISTDGGENSSNEYGIRRGGLARLNALIEAKKALGWEFIFLGSGESGWLSGQVFDIPVYATAATNRGYSGSYVAMASSVMTTRTKGVSVNSTLAGNLQKEGALVEEPKTTTGNTTKSK